MNITNSLDRIVAAKASMRQSIINKGVNVPEGAKIESYSHYVSQIGSEATPSLTGLKQALDNGNAAELYPINSTVPDKYDGQDFNWVIGHYGTATMSDGMVKDGVYLFVEKALSEAQPFGATGYYDQSPINTYLNETYLANCSKELKGIVGEISVPVYTDITVKAKLWLMSVAEVFALAPSAVNGGGVAWDAWKIRIGGSSPETGPTQGRKIQNESGEYVYWWLRSMVGDTSARRISSGGSLYGGNVSESNSILPACFIPGGSTEDATPKTVASNLQRIIDAKATIRQAIIDKGVEVPNSEKIDTYHTYIDQISVSLSEDGTEWGTLYTTAYPDGLVLTSEADYAALGNSGVSTNTLSIAGKSVVKSSITGFSFGRNCTYTPAYFLQNCPRLNRLDYVEHLNTIGNNFLVGCTSFNSPITISQRTTSVGSYFMYRCDGYTSTITIETNTTPPANDGSSLSSSDSRAAMYTQGIKITGTGAAAWKTALPNVAGLVGAFTYYRKLIIV